MDEQKIHKTDEEWRKILSPEQYHVTRERGTEAPFTGKYYTTSEEGVYVCSNCGAALFSSGDKYDSGSGWPSFTQPTENAPIDTDTDTSHGMVRTEITCARCGAHLGHVFNDGPQEKGGQRYCVNSLSLEFKPDPADS